ncbi:MAG TPA: hypothetical protein VFB21_23375 [Chthonomonadaceae bacterium]|nr:hypothetical protein [Chthonomonadaceae bacterium]
MNDLISTQPAPRTTAEYKAAIKQLFAEMDRRNQQMECDRRDITRLEAETAALKTETRAILASLGARL